MANKPSEEFLKNVKDLVNRRFKEAKKVVDSKVDDWDKYKKLYKVQQVEQRRSWESNLVPPKAHYVVETIYPQIMSTIFSVAQWITLKHPQLDTARLEQWLVWFLERYLKIFVTCGEWFKGSPIYGTSFNKTVLSNGIPVSEYRRPHNVFPDPRHNKPGDVDGMPWIFERFEKDFSELEQATVTRIRMEEVPVPMMGPDGQPMMDPFTQQPMMMRRPDTEELVMEEIPIPYTDSLYFNLDVVWDKHLKSASETRIIDEETSVDLPTLTLVEMQGQIPTNFSKDDTRYTPGEYQEFIITGVLGSPTSDEIETIIRCEPSTFKYYDAIEGEKYLKFLTPSIYHIDEGNFWGIGAVEPIEGVVAEQAEHHNMVMDNYKRSVMTVLSVLEKSGLSKRDLPLSAYALWKVRNHGDVVPVEFPGIDVGSFSTIHQLLDREVDRTTSASQLTQGMPLTKRTTKAEYQGSLVESAKRWATFIQNVDHISLRPYALKLMVLMSQMPHVLEGKPFTTPTGDITIDPMELVGHEISFAATSVENEFSKYAKQERIPRLLQSIGQVLQATGGQWLMDLPGFMQEIESVYDWKNASKLVQPNRGLIPVGVAVEYLQQTNPEFIPALQELVEGVHNYMEEQMEGEEGKRSK